MTSGGPDVGGRLARWARHYQAPIGLAALFFIVVFSLMLVSADRHRSVVEAARDTPDSVRAQAHSPCPACGIARHCNRFTGQCELDQSTPPSCVKGAHYDTRAGFCLPEPTPRSTPVRSQTLRPPTPPATGPPSSGGGSPSPSSPPTPSAPAGTPTPQT